MCKVKLEVGSRYPGQLHATQSVSRLSVWYVLLQGLSRWSTISGSKECDRCEFDLGNRVAGLVNQVAGKALRQTNKVVRSEVGSWKQVSRAITCHAVSK